MFMIQFDGRRNCYTCVYNFMHKTDHMYCALSTDSIDRIYDLLTRLTEEVIRFMKEHQ